MKSKALDFWKNFDLFGVAPSLSYQGGGKSKTVYGTIFSYAMVCWMTMALIFSFENMILRKNPNTVTSTVEGKISGVPFGKDSIHIGFALLNANTGQYVVDPSIVTPLLVKTVVPKLDQNGQVLVAPSTQIIAPTVCSLDHFDGLFSATGFCLDANAQETVGTVENEVLTMHLMKCSNATSPVPCQDQTTIDNTFNNCTFLVTYPGHYIEPGNFKSPIKTKREFKYMAATASMSKTMQIFLQEYELQTDSGFILPDVETQNYIEVERTVIDGSIDGVNKMTALITTTGDKIIQKRSYMKIQQSLAGTVALTRVGFLICAFLLIPCTKVKYNQNLINDLFSLKDSTNKVSPQFLLNEKGKKRTHKGSLELNFDDKSLNDSQQLGLRRGSEDFSVMLTNKGGVSKQSQFSKLTLKNKQSEIIENSQHQVGIASPSHSELGSTKQILPKSFEYGTDVDSAARFEAEAACKDNSDHDSDKNSDGNHELPQTINIAVDSPEQQQVDSLDLKRESSTANSSPQKLVASGTQPELLPLSNAISNNKGDKFKDPVVLAWLRSTFSCFANKDSNKLKTGAKKISKELCAFRLIQKMREIDRLKMLLLNEEQRVIFDNLPKPVLMGPSESENSLEQAQRNGTTNGSSEIQNYFKLLANKPNKSALDCKLINWYESGQYCSQ